MGVEVRLIVHQLFDDCSRITDCSTNCRPIVGSIVRSNCSEQLFGSIVRTNCSVNCSINCSNNDNTIQPWGPFGQYNTIARTQLFSNTAYKSTWATSVITVSPKLTQWLTVLQGGSDNCGCTFSRATATVRIFTPYSSKIFVQPQLCVIVKKTYRKNGQPHIKIVHPDATAIIRPL